jgi:hypothetical protein
MEPSQKVWWDAAEYRVKMAASLKRGFRDFQY